MRAALAARIRASTASIAPQSDIYLHAAAVAAGMRTLAYVADGDEQALREAGAEVLESL